jgi:sigma-E factor negative regulatory protein RseB
MSWGRASQRLGLLAGLALALPAFAIESMVSVQQTLTRMVDASRNLSYRGVATYEQGGTTRTVSVMRAIRGGRQLERLEYLDGPRRELIRKGDSSNCDHIADLLLKGGVPGSAGAARFEDYYHASFQDDDRVAGRVVKQIYLEPRDSYRYGHLLGVDASTGLLLQALVLDGREGVVERFKFTAIEIGALIDETASEPRLESHTVVAADNCLQPVAQPALDDDAESPWQAAWVPPGFTLISPPQISPGGLQEMHYTDGLGAFSVFIGPESGLMQDVVVRRGATVAYVLHSRYTTRSYIICVVGELPPLVAKRIAESIRPAMSHS